ncbi:alpha/beta-hydrolase [Gymnopus androsaceus JB14]|uniref:Alpha/beta-hydrolase n=1 Tax=Gymnopus androsaceus JB14 TaxID=1447944 RepID=A0A6A4IBT7_9AGAR|nr:alpha/beta-hydrolase [Gymnopus androsaceus JB14]
MFTPQEIAGAEGISSFSLSKDASSLVYAFGSLFKPKDGPKTSALWIADTLKELDAKRLIPTSTNFDHSPSFHPVSNDVYFLSDRYGGPDGPTHIYRLAGSEPQAVASFDKSESVTSFKISPDGSYIAFISTEKNDTNKTEEIEVWEEKKTNLGSLRVIFLNSDSTEIRTLVSTDAHVASFVWSPDSTSIGYRLHRRSDDASRDFPVIEALVSLDSGNTRDLYTHPRSPYSNSILTSSKPSITAYLQPLPRESFSSVSALYIHDFGSGEETVLYGENEDAVGLIDVQYNNQVAVEVWTGLNRRIDIVDLRERTVLFTVLRWKEEHMMSWDIRFNSTNGNYVVAALRSSAVTGEAPEVWILRTEKDTLDSITKGTRLSDNYSSYTPDKAPTSRAFQWTSVDGETIEGIISHPRGAEDLSALPAVLYIHGGPYMAEAFWLILGFPRMAHLPSLQRLRRAFSKLSRKYLFKLGLIDPKNIAIVGYSQGGFLTAWGCSRPANNEYTFKAGVCGAGPTSWGSLVESSDRPDMEAFLGGSAPWTPGEPIYLRGSPIKDACNVQCPMLFLNGKEDLRIPLTQAIAMVRGIERVSKAPKAELVFYPREGHIFDEAAHVEDMYTRLLGFLDRHMKTSSYGQTAVDVKINSTSFIDIFRGISYGTVERFKRTTPPSYAGDTTTVVNATFPGAACPQVTISKSSLATTDYGTFGFGEDCTLLDIYRPRNTTIDSKLPVMLWVYGGELIQGASFGYSGSGIVAASSKMDLPVITVYSFLTLIRAAIKLTVVCSGGQEADDNGALNLGLYDQRDAMQWVQNYIEYFGGDKDKVTLFGQSSGSMCIAYHYLTEDTSLFRGAILESGVSTSVPVLPPADYQNVYDALVNLTGCSSSSDTFQCIQTVNESVLEDAANTIAGAPNSYSARPWAVAIDGEIIPDSPAVLTAQGKMWRSRPIGDVQDEGTVFVQPQALNTTDDYVTWIGLDYTTLSTIEELYPDVESLGSPYGTGNTTFFGEQFKRGAATYGVFHASDVLFVFLEISETSPQFALAEQTIAYWLSFANHINPNFAKLITGAPIWEQYGSSKKSMYMSTNVTKMITDDFRQEQTDFLLSVADQFLTTSSTAHFLAIHGKTKGNSN